MNPVTDPKIDVGKFNDFINKASELLSCDETCQRTKNELLLKEKFLKAKVNYITAPNKVETSYKNYLTYSKGEEAYSEYNIKMLSEKARTLARTFASEFQEQVQKAKSLISTYDGLFVNFVHVVEYYNDLVQKNNIMSLSLKNKSSDIITNDRKTFYEDQKIDSLYFYYRIILFIYVVVLISYAVSIIFKPADIGRKKQSIILVLFIIYPFVATRLFLYIGDLYEKFKNILPKNVYKSEEPTYSPDQQSIDIKNRQPQKRISGCGGTPYGCCSDGTTAKIDAEGTNCSLIGGCNGTRYGCCSDGITTKVDYLGTNCSDYVVPVV